MTAFKAERVVKSYTMHLVAPPAAVFPLLCPVREYEWIEPWRCDMVFSAGGAAENNAVFITDFESQGGAEVWVVSRYEKNRAIEFIRVTPGLKVNRLDLSLRAADSGTRLIWTHTFTGLSEAGNRWIRSLTDEAFALEKAAVEKMLNHYLETGAMLKIADLNIATQYYDQDSDN